MGHKLLSTKKVNELKDLLAVGEAAKVAPKKGPKMPIEEYVKSLSEIDEDEEESAEGEEEGHGKIWHILKCYTRGYSKKDIAHYGKEYKAWAAATVYRQCGEYDKLRKAPATHYQGFEVFESRVRRIMSAKKLSREKAVEYIYGKDLE